MTLTLNGEPRQVAADSTVAKVVAELAGDANARGVAVAVNGEVVPRSTWPSATLRDGDTIEVLTAVQGG